MLSQGSSLDGNSEHPLTLTYTYVVHHPAPLCKSVALLRFLHYIINISMCIYTI